MDGMALAIGERWSPGPAKPRASTGRVDVWRADLAAAPDALAELLCAEERARARRIVPGPARTLWPRSRGILRALLARYLDDDPRSLRFARGPRGKPALLRKSGQEPDLRFNLSHSGAQMLVAVTAGHEIGVDIERATRRGARGRHELALAARRFGSEQARRLRELEPDARTREFLRAWSAHEAMLKCLGSGLSCAQSPVSPASATELWSAPLDMGSGSAAAVAVEGHEQRELRCFQWPG
jgi:4'-phosphopantetheinyl transferase